MVVESTTVASGASHSGKAHRLRFVLITPARNEEAFLEETIRSVIGQTTLPLKWVIVSDGSTDGTDQIVETYSEQHPWIELVKVLGQKQRDFAGKVHAFNAGYARVRDLDYDIIGNLDADVTFDADYLDFLLSRFQYDATLGVAGTPFREGSFQYDYRFVSKEHVSGACQLFRRECFEAVGGYRPMKRGVDLVAVTTARMKGWKTRCYTEKYCYHHRKQGTSIHNSFMISYWSGYYDYVLGVCPLWQVIRSVYEFRSPPYVIGGCCLFAGYLCGMLRRAERTVSFEFVAFRKKEAMKRLRTLVFNLLTLRGLHADEESSMADPPLRPKIL